MFADRETIGGRAVALLLLVGSTVVSSAAIKDKIFPVQRLQRRIVSLSEADDKYKSPPQPPLLWVETPESLIEIGHLSCNKTKELNDKIVAEVTPETATWENVFLPMVVEGNEMTFKENPAYFYQYVGLTAELRDASVEASTIMDECGVEESMRQDVFALVDAVYQKRDSLGLDPESLRFVEKSYLGYIDSGLGLPADKRARFKEISSRMNDLETQYSQNINNANGGVWLTPEQLKGTPENVLEGLEKGTGDNEGKMKLTWEYTDYYPFQSHALDPKARLEAYLGYENRVVENVPILKEAIVLRDEAARMLGYKNHAEFRIKDKMAKTPENVFNFLHDLQGRLTPIAQKEVDTLLKLKEADYKERGLDFDNKLYYWDYSFYDNLLVEKDYQIDLQKISEYFEVLPTLDKLMSIFQDLFGFVFIRLDDKDKAHLSSTGSAADLTWHPDVVMYAVWDNELFGGDDDGFRGYLYLDLHPRDGKYTHAADWGLINPFALEKPLTGRNHVTNILVCNLSKPTATKPALLLHSEVETVFHELGHGIHHLASRPHYSRFAGHSVARDFIEAPSQMLENWVWTPSVLKNISAHYETGKPLPDEMIANLIRTRRVDGGISYQRQLHYGLFDMMMHTPESHDAVEKFALSEEYNKLRPQVQPGLSGPQDYDPKKYNMTWGNGETTLGHYMGGYDAGYYGYLWSEVYSIDMFYSKFKQDPMNGAEGRRYRHTVLEKGATEDEMDFLTEYLGRAPSTTSFYIDLGLAGSESAGN